MRGDLRAVFVGGQEKLARITIDENGTEATEIVDGAITHRNGYTICSHASECDPSEKQRIMGQFYDLVREHAAKTQGGAN